MRAPAEVRKNIKNVAYEKLQGRLRPGFGVVSRLRGCTKSVLAYLCERALKASANARLFSAVARRLISVQW